MSIPRSCSRSSTFLSDSRNFTYIITTRRITSGDESNQRNVFGGLFERAIRATEHGLSRCGTFELTEPN
jgi:hypothetical protein